MSVNLEDSAVATGLEKISFHSNSKEGQCQKLFKLPHNCTHFCMLIRLCSKSFSSMWTKNFQIDKLDLEKAEEPEIQLPTLVGSQRKQESSRKSSTYASLTTLTPLTVWITTHCGKFLKKWEYQTTLAVSWGICMQVKNNRTRHRTDRFKIGKRVRQGCMLALCLFNLYAEYIMWNARLDESQAGIKIVKRNINNFRYADDITLMAESEEELKSLLIKVK